jgi:hypothetical protein
MLNGIKIFLIFCGVFGFGVGIMLMGSAKGSVHEVQGLICMLIGVVAIGSVGIMVATSEQAVVPVKKRRKRATNKIPA